METTTVSPIAPTAVAAAALALFYDTETTGLPIWKEPSEHPDQPHMVQLAAKLVNLDTREVLKSMDVLIKPDGWVIPDDVIAVHGITNERAAAEGIPEKDALDQFMELVAELGPNDSAIGHNESFDRRIVRIAVKRYLDPLFGEGDPVPSDAWKAIKSYCTCYKARAHTKLEKNKLPKLTEAYQHFMGKPMEGAHSAGGDVDGCIAVYWAIQAAEAPALKAA
jgi:DNA polymerase III subunit epsilon